MFSIGATRAAELAGIMTEKSMMTIEIPESQSGKYIRLGVAWNNEHLNKKATQFIRNNNNVKGRPNLTVGGFCEWVNTDLLINETLEPGYPRKIGLETACKWMHELGFEVVAKKKGTFVDTHECEDVVEYCKNFLCKMVGLGFLSSDNAPPPLKK